MYSNALMVFLRLIHIFSGVFWVGSIFVTTWFFLPANKTTGQAGLTVMQEVMVKRNLSKYLVITMLLNVLSGLTMYGYMIMTTHGEWASTVMARVLGVGAVCALIAGGVGASISKRTGLKMAAIGTAIRESGQPPTPAQLEEISALQGNIQRVMGFVAILLIIAVAAMASARYL